MVHTISIIVWITSIMPTKYIVLIASGNEKDSTLVTILISKVSEIGEIARSKDASCKNYWHSAME